MYDIDMNKDTLINLRVNKTLKENFQSIVEREGFTMSEVLEASMKDIVKRNIVPINIRSKIESTKNPVISIPFIKACLEKAIVRLNLDKIQSVSLFGSYSKGTAKPNSDVDLLIEYDDGFSYSNFIDLQNSLEEYLGKKIDLVTKGENDYFMNHIQREKIQLYERRP